MFESKLMATILTSCNDNSANTEPTITTVNATTVTDGTLHAETKVTLITRTDIDPIFLTPMLK